ncbi:hypothetical protein [Bradyrhizobium cenepequi]
MPDGLHQDRSEGAERPDPLRRMITRSATPFAVAMIVGFACPVRADLAPAPALPQFSKTDLTRIERNATLRELYLYNPWLTYRVLRAIDEAVETRRDLGPSQSPPPASPPFDEKRDPDLGEFQRVAPEAAVDLFAMIKKASGSNPTPK